MKINNGLANLLILALAGTAGAFDAFGQNQPIYSVNKFGFRKLSVPAESHSLAGMPFQASPAGFNGAIGNQLTPGNDAESADQILVWDKAHECYKIYYLQGEATDTNFSYKWIDTSTDPFTVATNGIAPGQGFWVRSRQTGDQQFVIVGEIVNQASYTTAVGPGLQMLCYPYSCSIKLNDTTLGITGVAGTNMDNADVIMLWDAGAKRFHYFYLLSDSNPEYDRKWIDMDVDEVATNSLPAGSAFWYKHTGTGFDWTEVKPY